MTEVPFHATRGGRTFFESHVPELLRQLKRLNETLERLANAARTQGESDDEAQQHDDQEEQR